MSFLPSHLNRRTPGGVDWSGNRKLPGQGDGEESELVVVGVPALTNSTCEISAEYKSCDKIIIVSCLPPVFAWILMFCCHSSSF